MQPIEPNRSGPPGFEPQPSRPADADAEVGSDIAGGPPPDVDVADAIDLDAVERDLDDVERTLDRLADGTYWSDDGTDPAGAATGPGTDEQPGASA